MLPAASDRPVSPACGNTREVKVPSPSLTKISIELVSTKICSFTASICSTVSVRVVPKSSANGMPQRLRSIVIFLTDGSKVMRKRLSGPHLRTVPMSQAVQLTSEMLHPAGVRVHRCARSSFRYKPASTVPAQSNQSEPVSGSARRP